jgi:nitrite reductase (NADH) large subunit
MRYCVVGLGPAGAQAVEAIRERDPEGSVTVFSDEKVPFYFRASLPQYALGLLERDQMWGLPDDYYAARRVERVSARVTAVAPERQRLVTEDGAEHPYDRLLLACGTAVPPPHVPGAELEGVVTLRTLADAEALRGLCREGERAVVVGGSLGALPLAYVARRRGMRVTLLVPEPQVGLPWLDARGGQIVYRRLVEDGVEVQLGASLAGIDGEGGRVAAVRTSGGRGIACRWVGLGTEAVPRGSLLPDLANGADGALPVDARMETRVPGVFAAGDVCRVWDPATGTHPHPTGWLSASLQGRVAGRNMAGGAAAFSPAHYHHAGMLYDVPLTVMGRFDATGDAEVTSAPTADGYRRLLFQDGRLIGATLLGDRRHATVVRRVIELGVDVRGYELQLLRTDVDLNRLLRPAGEYHLY